MNTSLRLLSLCFYANVMIETKMKLLCICLQENAERIRIQSENAKTPMGDARAPTGI